VGKEINGLKILHIDEMENFIRTNKVDIAILTVPSQNISEVADKVAALGVKGIWNFSPQDLKLAGDIVVENVHLSDGLMVLGYRIKEKEQD